MKGYRFITDDDTSLFYNKDGSFWAYEAFVELLLVANK